MTLPVPAITRYENDLATIQEFGNAEAIHALATLIRTHLSEEPMITVPSPAPEYTTVYPTPISQSSSQKSIRWVPIVVVSAVCCLVGVALYHLVRVGRQAVINNGWSVLFGVFIIGLVLFILSRLGGGGNRKFSGTFEGRFH